MAQALLTINRARAHILAARLLSNANHKQLAQMRERMANEQDDR